MRAVEREGAGAVRELWRPHSSRHDPVFAFACGPIVRFELRADRQVRSVGRSAMKIREPPRSSLFSDTLDHRRDGSLPVLAPDERCSESLPESRRSGPPGGWSPPDVPLDCLQPGPAAGRHPRDGHPDRVGPSRLRGSSRRSSHHRRPRHRHNLRRPDSRSCRSPGSCSPHKPGTRRSRKSDRCSPAATLHPASARPHRAPVDCAICSWLLSALHASSGDLIGESARSR
jgi:hypothetical protein